MQPDEHFIGRVCEEFQCTPLEAVLQPIPLTVRIIEQRDFARMHRAMSEASSEKDVPDGPTKTLYVQVRRRMNAWLVQEGQRRKRGGSAPTPA